MAVKKPVYPVDDHARDKATKDTWAFAKSKAFAALSMGLAITSFCIRHITDSWAVAVLAALLFFVIILVSYWIWRYRVHLRSMRIQQNAENVYGEAILLLNRAFSVVHRVRRSGASTLDDITEALTETCGKLKAVYDTKTGAECSICIKVVADQEGPVKNETVVKTLCRDGVANSNPKRTTVDMHKGVVHDIFHNDSFRNFFDHVRSPRGLAYVNNDLPSERNYKSTSFEVHGHPKDWDPIEKRWRDWTLPYRAEIVVPIGPYGHQHNEGDPLIYGFLCVDSPAENVFNETYDVEILRGVADGIVDVMEAYIALARNIDSSEAVSNTTEHGQE